MINFLFIYFYLEFMKLSLMQAFQLFAIIFFIYFLIINLIIIISFNFNYDSNMKQLFVIQNLILIFILFIKLKK